MERTEIMKSLVIEKPGSVVFREQPVPVPKEGEALLKLLYGADMRENQEKYPCTFNVEPPYEVTSTPWLTNDEIKMLKEQQRKNDIAKRRWEKEFETTMRRVDGRKN